MDTVRLLLESEHAPRADCQDGEALLSTALTGHVPVARLLLEWPEHAPRADCQDGWTLVLAAQDGHLDLVELLLGWPVHPPMPHCRDGDALIEAARNGHEGVVELLLEHESADFDQLTLESAYEASYEAPELKQCAVTELLECYALYRQY